MIEAIIWGAIWGLIVWFICGAINAGWEGGRERREAEREKRSRERRERREQVRERRAKAAYRWGRRLRALHQ